jgi:hypothetical protein
VAGPNVDTLYGFAWLDLQKEPLVLSVPETHDRYYSIQLIDMYSNSFAYVGRRATGTKAGRYLIAGPGWKGSLPHGVSRIDAPTNRLLVLTRTSVRGHADLPAAQAVQIQYTLTPLSKLSGPAIPPLTAVSAISAFPVLDLAGAGAKYFDEFVAGLAVDPPPGAREFFKRALCQRRCCPGPASRWRPRCETNRDAGAGRRSRGYARKESQLHE